MNDKPTTTEPLATNVRDIETCLRARYWLTEKGYAATDELRAQAAAEQDGAS